MKDWQAILEGINADLDELDAKEREIDARRAALLEARKNVRARLALNPPIRWSKPMKVSWYRGKWRIPSAAIMPYLDAYCHKHRGHRPHRMLAEKTGISEHRIDAIRRDTIKSVDYFEADRILTALNLNELLPPLPDMATVDPAE
jgi:hypothetical protein